MYHLNVIPSHCYNNDMYYSGLRWYLLSLKGVLKC